ncbi:MAG: thioredoxin [Candidatus Alcyoniella australis]|nr:thioredoxin [Candidatus Alcyoniella australis]
MADLLTISDENFDQEVIKSDLPTLVDFWAPWCGPCRMVGPVVEELAGEYAGKIKVVKLNVDEAQRTASQYGIRSIPTIMLFNGGQVVEQVIGAVPKAKLEELLRKVL